MELVVAGTGHGYVSALLGHKQELVEVQTDDQVGHGVGAIYVGRVEQVKKNINSAFVKIADGEKVFLSLNEVDHFFFTKKIGKGFLPVQGDELLVQIEKEAHKTKLAKATANLVLTGRYVILTTDKKNIFVSSKIRREKLRKIYKGRLKSKVTNDFGFIIRTNAEKVTIEEIEAEMDILSSDFYTMTEHLNYKSLYQTLYRPEPKYLTMIRDLKLTEPLTVIACDEHICAEVQALIDLQKIDGTVVRGNYPDDEALMNAYSLRDKLSKLFMKKVWLKSGATIIIEPTEAMTVIDVNTEKSLSKKKSNETILKTNIEAAEMIVYQMRVRNISGILIVDFIDMKSEADKNTLLENFDRLCAKDSVKTTVHGMTVLGLVEVTRKKIDRPLWENTTVRGLLNL